MVDLFKITKYSVEYGKINVYNFRTFRFKKDTTSGYQF